MRSIMFRRREDKLNILMRQGYPGLRMRPKNLKIYFREIYRQVAYFF